VNLDTAENGSFAEGPSQADAFPQAPPARTVLTEILEERTRLREEMESLRDLSSRLIDLMDQKDQRIEELQALEADLEAENAALITGMSACVDRISALESFVRTMAEADEQK
jgi:hypothetical protein